MKTVLIIFLAAAAPPIALSISAEKPRLFVTANTVIASAAALFAVNIAGLATGIQLSVNRWSLGAGALLGVPGVISMLVLDIVFK